MFHLIEDVLIDIACQGSSSFDIGWKCSRSIVIGQRARRGSWKRTCMHGTMRRQRAADAASAVELTDRAETSRVNLSLYWRDSVLLIRVDSLSRGGRIGELLYCKYYILLFVLCS